MRQSINGVVFIRVGLEGISSKVINKASVHRDQVFAKHKGNIPLEVPGQRNMDVAWSDANLGGG